MQVRAEKHAPLTTFRPLGSLLKCERHAPTRFTNSMQRV